MKIVLERLSAAIGALICLVGAFMVATEQASIRTVEPDWFSIWPLPGLVLAEWGLLGLIVLLGILVGKPWTIALAWAACGALVALVVLGAFSIGPTVLLALVFLTAAALMASLRQARDLFRDTGSLLLGTLANFAILALLVLMENRI